MAKAVLATCNLNQWALDFDGNLARIKTSILMAKEAGARYRLGPELEVPGYGCQDHFLEQDTYLHSWEAIADLLADQRLHGLLIDVGAPVVHRNVRYNCRVILLNGKVVMIRPKLHMANDGNYREMRYFTPWPAKLVQEHVLPSMVRALTGQRRVPFGDLVLATNDTVFGTELCEELFVPDSPHVDYGLDGVEIVTNGSGSHHVLRKLHRRVELMQYATTKNGGAYVYANQQGCDGDRLYYDGSAMVFCNGALLAQGTQFSLRDVEVVTAVVNVEEIRSFRSSLPSRSLQATASHRYERVHIDFDACVHGVAALRLATSKPRAPHYHTPQEEIALGPACWLWDYLRRSRTAGFFLPLSGGADSASVCAMVGSMCQVVMREVAAGNAQVLVDVRRLMHVSDDTPQTWRPESARALAHAIFHTCYMGSKNSSAETRDRAKRLAEQVGAYHCNVAIDSITSALVGAWRTVFPDKEPRFKTQGGSETENLALQNIQARSRMVLAYLFAQLGPWARGYSGGLLVLGAGNVDEALRGYMTKYDCSSADLNPIGAISKVDLKAFLTWAATHLGYPALAEIGAAPPTAELEPITAEYTQTDEDDMGMSYDELGEFGRLRKLDRCGPYGMFSRLVSTWSHLRPAQVADKVKRFFFFYAINRHKLTVLTPSYHAENYSPDDNRFDLRQFLYNARWPWQFRKIDATVTALEQRKPHKL